MRSVSSTRLEVHDGIQFNEARRALEKVVATHDAAQWWVGDALNAMERFRRDYPDALAQIDRKYAHLSRYARVASRVQPDDREPTLTWQHHHLVASLPDDQRRVLLDHAVRGDFDHVAQMKQLVQTRPPRDQAVTPAPSADTRSCMICGKPLLSSARRDKKTCSDRCRKEKSRLAT